jgi:hypothetical protein
MVGEIWQTLVAPVGMQDTASPSNRLLGRRSLLFRNLFVEPSYYLSTLPTPCLQAVLQRLSTVAFGRRRWCTGGAAKGVSTLCKRSACDADVLESNERREILFSADHSVGRSYILVPYWSIAMHTGRGSYIAPTIFERVKWKAPCCGNV